jgi:hypothetical protein
MVQSVFETERETIMGDDQKHSTWADLDETTRRSVAKGSKNTSLDDCYTRLFLVRRRNNAAGLCGKLAAAKDVLYKMEL